MVLQILHKITIGIQKRLNAAGRGLAVSQRKQNIEYSLDLKIRD